jgi:hypothetical protein
LLTRAALLGSGPGRQKLDRNIHPGQLILGKLRFVRREFVYDEDHASRVSVVSTSKSLDELNERP